MRCARNYCGTSYTYTKIVFGNKKFREVHDFITRSIFGVENRAVVVSLLAITDYENKTSGLNRCPKPMIKNYLT